MSAKPYSIPGDNPNHSNGCGTARVRTISGGDRNDVMGNNPKDFADLIHLKVSRNNAVNYFQIRVSRKHTTKLLHYISFY